VWESCGLSRNVIQVQNREGKRSHQFTLPGSPNWMIKVLHPTRHKIGQDSPDNVF